MKHEIKINGLLRIIKIADTFRRWLCEDGESLVAAADLLGGSAWARHASAVCTCARNGGDLHTHRQKRVLDVALKEVGFAPSVFDAGGLGKEITIQRLPDAPLERSEVSS